MSPLWTVFVTSDISLVEGRIEHGGRCLYSGLYLLSYRQAIRAGVVLVSQGSDRTSRGGKLNNLPIVFFYVRYNPCQMSLAHLTTYQLVTHYFEVGSQYSISEHPSPLP